MMIKIMKTTVNKPVTAQQVKALHATFRSLGMDDENRHNFVSHFTDGRTCSTKGLTMEEARKLLDTLDKDRREMYRQEAKRICKQIYALSFRISFLNKGFGSTTEEEFEMNKAKINVFCRRCTKARKNLTEMNLVELKEVKKQMEAIARRENEDAE